MAKKRYNIKTGCPQCGCSGVQALSEEEMRERYGDVPNFDMECSECMEKYTADMKTACPEWDKDCKLQEQAHRSDFQQNDIESQVGKSNKNRL